MKCYKMSQSYKHKRCHVFQVNVHLIETELYFKHIGNGTRVQVKLLLVMMMKAAERVD